MAQQGRNIKYNIKYYISYISHLDEGSSRMERIVGKDTLDAFCKVVPYMRLLFFQDVFSFHFLFSFNVFNKWKLFSHREFLKIDLLTPL